MFVSFYLFLNALHTWSTAMVMLGRSVVFELASSCADPENFLRGGASSQKGSDGKFQHGKN